jgi:hypothetical protein
MIYRSEGLKLISFESIKSICKDNLSEASKTLDKNDIGQLVEWLSLKEDDIRYQAFLLLKNRSVSYDDVYPYWDVLKEKLKSDNSYQRSIGLMLISENVRWDTDNRIADTIDDYLQLLNDEKPVTVRQCIQSLGMIASLKPCLNDIIAARLISIDLVAVKETMRKSILLDILNILAIIGKEHRADAIESYIKDALASDILDKKSKKQMENLLM